MNSFLLRAPLALLVAFPAAAQSLNVDVGSVLGVPGNGYGAAAAQPGEWNQMNDGTSMSLVGLAGQATGASVSALGANFAFWFDNTGTSGDDEQLMDDACDGPVTYTFSGLAPGDYTVYTYAWAPDNATYLSTVSVVGSGDPAQVVGGAWPAGHALGVTYAKHDVAAPSGQIVIDVTVSSGFATSNGFQLVATGAGGPGTFCTSTPSSLAGCTSTLSGPSGTVSKSAGAGSYTLSAGPAPGGNQAGIFIWGKSQLAVPVLATFGWRCIPVTRGKPALPGGTVGLCNGQYDWDVGAYVNTTGAINVGDSLNFQSWYRDPGLLPQAALFTQGVGPLTVTP